MGAPAAHLTGILYSHSAYKCGQRGSSWKPVFLTWLAVGFECLASDTTIFRSN